MISTPALPKRHHPAPAMTGRPASEHVVLDPGGRYRALVGAIKSARHSLDLSIFRCDDPFIIEVLEEAHARGVRVRVLLTNRAKGGSRQLAWLETVLRRAGIDVMRYGGVCQKYHAKYALIDGTRCLVSSMNLTREHFTDTDDVLLLSRDRALYGALASMFDSDWRGDAASLISCDRLIVSPDNARARFAALIASARRSLVIVDHKLADLDMLDLVLAAQSRGVVVHLITDERRFDARSHGKFMVIDDRLAVVGSLALSASTLDQRRDAAVIVSDPGLVRELAAHIRPARAPRPTLRHDEPSLVS